MTEDLNKRLDKIEHILSFYAEAYKTLHNHILKGVEVRLNSTHVMKEVNALKDVIYDLESFVESLKGKEALGTFKYFGKKLQEIDISISEMKNEGLVKNIRFDLSLDGYKMIKAKHNIDTDQYNESDKDPEYYIKHLISLLDEREKLIICHKYGLLGHDKLKTYVQISKIVDLCKSRVAVLHRHALRKFRKKYLKNIVNKTMHVDLINDVLGDKI